MRRTYIPSSKKAGNIMTSISTLRGRLSALFFTLSTTAPRPRPPNRGPPPAPPRLRLEPLEDRWPPANPAVNLDQWGDLTQPPASQPPFWQNGNLGQSSSLY